MPVTGPVDTDATIVPPVRPANPPTMLLDSVLVTDPAAPDDRITPAPVLEAAARR